MPTEPIARKFSYAFERPRFLKEMRGARHDLERHVGRICRIASRFI